MTACGSCGALGHNRRTCTAVPYAPPSTPGLAAYLKRCGVHTLSATDPRRQTVLRRFLRRRGLCVTCRRELDRDAHYCSGCAARRRLRPSRQRAYREPRDWSHP